METSLSGWNVLLALSRVLITDPCHWLRDNKASAVTEPSGGYL